MGNLVGLVKRLFRRGLANPPQWFVDSLTAAPAASGIRVTEEGSLALAAVYACVKVLAESVASLPCILYERLPDGAKRRAEDHPLYEKLRWEPNAWQTAAEYWETVVVHTALWGNHFSLVERDGAGRVAALVPVQPERFLELRLVEGQIFYVFEGMDPVGRDDVLHVRAIGTDGFLGKSPIRQVREAVGLGLAAQEFGARFFGQGTTPGLIFRHPGRLGDEAFQRLKQSLQASYEGLGKSHKAMVLEEGIEIQSVTMPLDDAQFIETRKFQAQEIARIYRVPPHMIADLDRATFSNIEHQSIEFVMHTLRPWLVRIEQACRRVLLTPPQRQRYFVEFLVNGLLRGDIASRYQAYAIARQNGWLSANDIRRLENMNPIDGGDTYLVPLNMVPAGDGFDGADPDGEGQRALPVARIEHRGLNRRMGLRTKHHGSMAEAARLALAAESDAIRGILAEAAGTRSASNVLQAVRDWYDRERPTLIAAYEPAISRYARELAEAVSAEVGRPVPEDKLADFLRGYLGALAKRHAGWSLAAIEKKAASVEPEALAEAIEGLLNEWAETRPDRIAADETVRADGAITKAAMIAAGVQALRWVTQGSRACPYCRALDGKIVGIAEAFLPAGAALEVDGAETPMEITGPKGHPPLHDGCVCAIVAA